MTITARFSAPGPPGGAMDPYAAAVHRGRGPLYLRRAGGGRQPVPVERWCAPPDRADETLLQRCRGLALDVGCGPGRLTAALSRRGCPALGLDIAPWAVARTTAAGGTALRRSVFDRLPAEGRWNALVLADGNIGIGGDPSRLLRRSAHLLDARGVVLVEVEHAEIHERFAACFEDAKGHRGPLFRWARAGASAVERAARRAGLVVTDRWACDRRHFVALRTAGDR